MRTTLAGSGAAILARLETMPERPTVIMGDFNEWSRTRGQIDGFEVHVAGQTFPTRRPVAALDRFATGKGVKAKSLDVVSTPVTRIASDHLPIRGVVTF